VEEKRINERKRERNFFMVNAKELGKIININ
jgi:hypothetical protein